MQALAPTQTDWSGPVAIPESRPAETRTDRIVAALGLGSDRRLAVDDDTLAAYYKYLAGNLSFPFVAYYPVPKNSGEEAQFRCTVLELLDPATYLGDEFDGISCRVRKGKYEIHLPLVELEVPQCSPDFPLIEDYWHWFWHWRF